MKVLAEQKSEKAKREENQDDMGWFTLPNGGELLIVADGMGGEAGGKTAAKMAIASIHEVFQKNLPEKSNEIQKILKQAIEVANDRIYEKGSSGDARFRKMGSTAIILYIQPQTKTAHIAHIGDSRLYLFRGGELILLTKDHSQVQRMVDDGLITPEIAFDHPDANIITRCLGHDPKIEADVFPKPYKILLGDQFMLCTDGLSGAIREHEIKQLFSDYNNNPQILCDRLIKAALDAGGSDNVTIQIVYFKGKPPDNINQSGVHSVNAQKSGLQNKIIIGLILGCIFLFGLVIYLILKTPAQDDKTKTTTIPPTTILATTILVTTASDTYIVKPGDTLSKIAEIYKTTVEKIKSWNNLQDEKNIKAGQIIIIQMSLKAEHSSSEPITISPAVKK